MPKNRPIEAKTRRGNRVYRNRSVHKGEVRYAEQYSFAIKKDGERHRLNLGASIDAAKKMADRIQAFLTVPCNTFGDLFEHTDFKGVRPPRRYSRRRRARAGASMPVLEKLVPTIDEILQRYETNAVHLSPTTVRNNTNSLRHLGASILGLRPLSLKAKNKDRQRWRLKTGRMSIMDYSLLALETIRTQAMTAAGNDGIARGKAATTLNSYFRFAQSIFSVRMMAFYGDFDLPDPLPFRQVRPLREPSRRYVSKVDVPAVIQAARRRFWDGILDGDEQLARDAHVSKYGPCPAGPAKSLEELVQEDKARFIALLLTISCGLRPKELSKLTWGQVDFDNRRINVAVTSYDTPKARSSESFIDVSQAVLDYLNLFRPYSATPPFVIPAVRHLDREPAQPGQAFFKVLYQWLRKNGADCENPLYVFRKEAGSIIYEQTDSYDRAADFLRNDPRIAREHYVGRKSRLEIEVPGLDSAA
jgi:integrase